MAFRLVIAEKPSVAQTIAAALGVKEKKDGYIEGGGCLISWCVGHLVQLAEAAAYGEQYKKWSFESLPILPEEWQYAVDPDKGKQFKTLKELMHRADVSEVVNACDAGREGELIFRFVYEAAGCKKPMRRLWISSMEDGENADVTLPKLSEGQGFPNPAAKVTEHTTTPPKPHSEASLLSAMERAGNGDTDPDAERRGLGTPATRAAVIEKLVKGGFAERKGKQLIPTKNGNSLICILPDILTSPQLTAEWENNLTQIAKGAADPGEFLSGIEAMARELVQTHAAALDGKKDLFREEKPSVGKCPRCGSPVHEGKKNYYCSNKECAFVMWKNDRFFEERKTAFSAKIAAALLKSGKANVKKLYSPKTGKTYDGTIVLADTGGKYVNYRIEVQKN